MQAFSGHADGPASRALPAALAFTALVLARLADVLTTLYFTPDLGQEANPIVTVFGAGVRGLLLANVGGIALLLLLPLGFYWRHPPAALSTAPANLREYVCLQLHGRVLSPRAFVFFVLLGWPPPRPGIALLRAMGFALCWTIACVSSFAVLSWWCTRGWGWEGYISVRAWFGSVGGYPVMEILAAPPAFLLAAWWQFRSEYKALVR